MSDDRRLVISTDPSLTAEDVSRRTFATAFRGWDPNAVKAYLARVAKELTHAQQRAKVLGDLGRRRKLAQVQVAQLRAGRERLLDAYRTVRRTLDEVSDELQRADAEARLAAEQAAIRASDVPEASVEELSANLTT